ncbi:Kef-type K+ transport system, NAD-binding component [Methylophaga frappieri]|uniref:Kef-type K+ transport system, NAD-binding component n=1 Tax=Methylophaga frappieri (strain ATCC BAA-2434 / DSM 25690 / JAM7) TaxID=754477 RepID=I1YEN5_METFJ|nr:ion transporter [Methylophaga frappieri]AFJ01378.1 Kef-type K+ transport system, NAD-binding component [Methylophaga frappieri]
MNPSQQRAFLSFQDHFEQLRHNRLFEWSVVAVIIFSALLAGAKTYDIPVSVSRTMVWLDYAITLFFLIEISIRFLGERRKRDFLKSGWNVFDTLIVIASLVPIEDSELAFVGRLLRIFRVLRMVSIIPELRHLLNSLLKALPQLSYVALMMFIIVYIFAAVGTSLFADINETLWGDIAVAMLTLFRVMTFEDWTDVMYETMAVYPLSWVFYLLFIFLNTFAFLNMLIGIVVNVMEQERQEAQQQLHKNDPTLHDVLHELQALKELVRQQTK